MNQPTPQIPSQFLAHAQSFDRGGVEGWRMVLKKPRGSQNFRPFLSTKSLT